MHDEERGDLELAKRGPRRLAVLVLALLAGLTTSSAAAAEDPLVLEWRAPQGCAEAEVRSEIARLGGSSLTREGPFRVRVDVGVRDGVWRATIRRATVQSEGEGPRAIRTIEAESCSTLARAVGLIVLVEARSPEAADETARAPAPEALDSADPANVPRDARTTFAGRAGPTPPSDRALLSSVSAPRNERSWRFFLSPRLAFDKGSLPGAGFGVGGQLGSTFGAQRLSLGFLVWPGLGASLEPSPSGSARFSLLAGALEDCLRLSRGAYALDFCGGMEIGRIQAEGGRDSNPDTTASLWAAPEGGIAASWKLGDRFRLRGALGSVVPLIRPEFRFRETGGETIHRTSWVAMRSSIEIELNY